MLELIDYDIIAIVIGINALVYMLIHIPLDILTIVKKTKREKSGAKEYPAWEKGKNVIKIITILTSVIYWIFFIIWPIIHFLEWDAFILFFNFEIPYVSEVFQYIGLILTSIGTFIACLGRISRSIYAISWGVPNKLTTHLGFKIVRHPLYSSYILYFVGIPLAMQNYLLIPLVLGIIGYVFTAKYEEQILLLEFGEEYKEYQRKVGMLLPFIGRRKDDLKEKG
ncbi:MAG: isoprenylcysteine carboxylmethyltransferase family protein [Asgard group archaeon]|nr:isoprenylcysteine carboxylmethyltransferase family protein [Asgard group archaeon]